MGDIMIWSQTRKSIVGPLAKSSSTGLSLNGKLKLLSYRFLFDATGKYGKTSVMKTDN